jgi:hypothetical protein
MDTNLINILFERYFAGDCDFKKYVPKNVSNWFVEVAQKFALQVKSKEEKAKLLHKFRHTKRVFDAGMEIAKLNVDGVDWNFYQCATVCLLHDVGRFPQAVANKLSDEISGIDHGEAGANLFSRGKVDIEPKYGCDSRQIEEAIRFHGLFEYKGENLYAKFIRDADKLGIFDEFHIQERYARHCYREGKLSDCVLESFRKGELADIRKVQTMVDWLVHRACWLNGFYFKSAKIIAQKRRYSELILSRLERYNIDEKTRKTIRERLSLT